VELSLYENELQPGDVLCFRGGAMYRPTWARA